MKTPAACSPEDPGDDDFYQQVYDELRKLVQAKMSKEYGYSPLQCTAFIHQVWRRMGGVGQPRRQNRALFFKAAAEAIRGILVDQACEGNGIRHGSVLRWKDETSLDNPRGKLPVDDQLLQLNQALEKLQEIDKQKAELFELRIFLGMSFKKVAEIMSISVSTTKRWWIFARTWLHREMSSQ